MKRIAGILRVKNDGMFIEPCIESCIDALDELIVVYNDCTDNSESEIKRMKDKYPSKIRYFEYPHKILGFSLNKKDYDIAINLPENSPNLLCGYCNFALAKVTCEYALKIDADQIYFTEELKKWCDFIRNCEPQKMGLKTLLGKCFSNYITLYRFLSIKSGHRLPIMPSWLVKSLYPAYISFAKYSFSNGKSCLSLSGVNVLEKKKTLISMGHKLNDFLSGYPFNGVGDTVIFKVSKDTYFEKFVMTDYNTSNAKSFSVIEQFRHPYKLMYVGYFWKHIRAMRPGVFEKSVRQLEIDDRAYLSIDKFEKLSYKQIEREAPEDIFQLFHRILFAFIYKANKKQMLRSLRNTNIFHYGK